MMKKALREISRQQRHSNFATTPGEEEEIKYHSQESLSATSQAFETITQFFREKVIEDESEKKLDDLKKLLREFQNKDIEITSIKDRFENTLSQYYIQHDNTNNSLMIIQAYYDILAFSDLDSSVYSEKVEKSEKAEKVKKKMTEKEKSFYLWLLNENTEKQTIFEIITELSLATREYDQLINKIFQFLLCSQNKDLILKLFLKRKENIFHLCARTNKVYPILYFYEQTKEFYTKNNKNILDEKNIAGLTPLHIACTFFNKKAADVLLVLGCNINAKNNEGNNSLYLAVKTGNITLTKKLIIFGGDKYSKNKQGESPYMYAWKYGNTSMKRLFSNNPFCSFTSLKDQDKTPFTFTFFVLVFLLKLAYFIFSSQNKTLVLSSFILDMFSLSLIIYFNTHSASMYIQNQLVLTKNKDGKLSMSEMYKRYCIYKARTDNTKSQRSVEIKTIESNEFKHVSLDSGLSNDDKEIKENSDLVCFACKRIKKKNIKHCILCGTCVENMDHHCFWLGRCVNKENYKYFFSLLVLLSIQSVVNVIVVVEEGFTHYDLIYNTDHATINKLYKGNWIIYGIIIFGMLAFGFIIISVLLQFYFLLCKRNDEGEKAEKSKANTAKNIEELKENLVKV